MAVLDILNFLLGVSALLYAIFKYMRVGLLKSVLIALVIVVAMVVFIRRIKGGYL